MLDYKNILTKRYALRLSLREIAEQTGAGKSGVHDFLKAFEKCEGLDYPLPPGITNAGIAMKVYGKVPGEGSRDESYEYPDYQADPGPDERAEEHDSSGLLGSLYPQVQG